MRVRVEDEVGVDDPTQTELGGRPFEAVPAPPAEPTTTPTATTPLAAAALAAAALAATALAAAALVFQRSLPKPQGLLKPGRPRHPTKRKAPGWKNRLGLGLRWGQQP